MKGTNMGTILFAVGVLLLVFAAFAYFKSENNSFSQVVNVVNDSRADAKKALQTVEEVKDSVEQMSARVTEMQMGLPGMKQQILDTIGGIQQQVQHIQTQQEILESRQHSLEKKILGKEQKIHLSVAPDSHPIQVEIISRKKGQGQGALLNRAGVTSEENK